LSFDSYKCHEVVLTLVMNWGMLLWQMARCDGRMEKAEGMSAIKSNYERMLLWIRRINVRKNL